MQCFARMPNPLEYYLEQPFHSIWLSVPLNILAPDDSWGRVSTMVLALLVPELVVGWAAWQLVIANRIAEENEGEVYHIFVGRP